MSNGGKKLLKQLIACDMSEQEKETEWPWKP